MKTIPQEAVVAAWDQMCDMSEGQARQLAERMQKEQPFLMVYLLAGEQEEDDERNKGSLLELGAFVWSLMAKRHGKLRTVTAEEIEAAEAANVRELERLEESSEAEWAETCAAMLEKGNQGPLLGVLVELLMSGNEETPELAGDDVGVGLLHLKTAVDCLDQ